MGVWGERTARRGQDIVRISKPYPGALWCPPPCPELLPRGWQMLFHRLRRVGGLRKVLLGGSGGGWGVGSGASAAASQPGLALSGLPCPSVPKDWGPGMVLQNLNWSLLPSLPPLPTKRLGSGPLPSLAASAEPPGKAEEEAQWAQNSGCPCSQVFARAVRDRQACGEFGACGAGGSNRVGGQAKAGKLGIWGCLLRLLNPAGTTILPAQTRRHILSCLYQYSDGSGAVTLAGV